MTTSRDAPQETTDSTTGGTGRLVVDCSYLPSATFLGATGPRIDVDGQQIKANWGPWPIDLPAGDYTVTVETRYMGGMGKATLPIEVEPGEETRIFYRAPATIFSSGSLGHVPQGTNGMGGLVVLIAIPIILMMVALLLI